MSIANTPTVITQTIRIPQPDGSILFRPGKSIVVEAEIGTTEAARLLGLSQRHIESQCNQGLFKTAYKPGGLAKSKWRISRQEVLARRTPPAN